MPQVPTKNGVRTEPIAADDAQQVIHIKEQILAMLADFEDEYPFNWDGNGGLPIRPDVVDTVRAIVLSRDGIDLSSLRMPLMFLESNGTVKFRFDGVMPIARKVWISVQCLGTISYQCIVGNDAIVEGDIIPAALCFDENEEYIGTDHEAVEATNVVLDWVRATKRGETNAKTGEV